MDLEKNEEFNGEYQYRTEDLLSTKKEDRQKRRQERKRIRHYKFSDKKHPKTAFVSIAFAVITTGLLIAAITLAVMAGGAGGSEVGICGFLSAVSSVIGAVFALIALSGRDVKTSLAWTGLLINGVIFVFIVCIILIYIEM